MLGDPRVPLEVAPMPRPIGPEERSLRVPIEEPVLAPDTPAADPRADPSCDLRAIRGDPSGVIGVEGDPRGVDAIGPLADELDAYRRRVSRDYRR